METVSILVDVQNAYYTNKQAYGRNFDYKNNIGQAYLSHIGIDSKDGCPIYCWERSR